MTALAPWTALPSLLVAASGWGEEIDIPWMLLDTKMGLDLTGRVFLGFTSLIWLLSGLYARSYLQRDKNLFFSFFLLALAGNLGLILSFDVVSFYFFFALMSFSSYVLVVLTKTEAAYFAGRVYIALVILGEILVFTALALAVYISGSLHFSDFAAAVASSPYLPYLMGFTLFGFGIKAGLLPLHVWLPLAHPVAPTPASAVLSACMIKAGILGWLRLFPLGDISQPVWGGAVISLGIIGAFYAALVGIAQKEEKTVLAYSSISQVGIMTFLIGLGLLHPTLWPEIQAVLLIYITAHALMKGALFLTVGVDVQSSTFCRIAACLPALAMAGAPFMAGGAAKSLIKGQVLSMIDSSYLAYLLEGTSYMTAFLMFRYLFLLFQNDRKGRQYGSWWVLLGILLLSPFFLLVHYSVGTLFSLKQLIPLIAAAIAGLIFVKFPIRFSIPSGDLLIVYEWGITRCGRFLRRLGEGILFLKNTAVRIFASICWPKGSALARLEETLTTFPVFGALLIGLTLVFFLFQIIPGQG